MDLRQYALTIMRDQIRQQFESRSSLDNKASWLLGFLAIVFTVFFSIQKSKVSHEVIVAVGALLLSSFILAVISLMVPISSLTMSPGVKPFRKFVEENVNDPTAMEDMLRKLSEDHVRDFCRNKIKLIFKQVFLYLGYILLLVSLIVMLNKAR